MIDDMRQLVFFDMMKPYNNRSSIDRGYRAEERAIKAKYSADMLELGQYLFKLLVAYLNAVGVMGRSDGRPKPNYSQLLAFERFEGAILEFDLAFAEARLELHKQGVELCSIVFYRKS